MEMFGRIAKMDIVAASGVLSVTIRPNLLSSWMSLEAVLIALFSRYAFRAWQEMSWVTRALFLWVEVGGVIGWFYQVSGSENIEIDSRQLRIRKETLGWGRVTEHPIEDCSALEVHDQGKGDHYGLQCKVGWRTVKFGEYLSEDQSIQVLTALQAELPDVAQKLGTNLEGKKHFITLGLSAQ